MRIKTWSSKAREAGEANVALLPWFCTLTLLLQPNTSKARVRPSHKRGKQELVIGSTILCSILNLQDICLFLALFSILVCLIPKLPSASTNPANQLLLKFDSLFTDFFIIFELWLTFIQSINLWSWLTLGVLNSPLISQIIFLILLQGRQLKHRHFLLVYILCAHILLSRVFFS